MKKSIVLCADDYGQAEAISQGILALVKLGRLSAVSCMVTTAYWPEHAKWLSPFHLQVDLGLHFNLTEGKSTLTKLIAKALFHRLHVSDIVTELNNQIDVFQKNMGFLPHFIDGHQHIQHFPIIRDALIEVYLKRFHDQKPYIRISNEKSKSLAGIANVKKLIVEFLGIKALKNRLIEHKIPHNQSFSGMYAFSQEADYSKLFPEFLQAVGDKGLIMCHPGLASFFANDPIASARYREYEYFMSEKFIADCAKHGVIIERFRGVD